MAMRSVNIPLPSVVKVVSPMASVMLMASTLAPATGVPLSSETRPLTVTVSPGM
jgi:hypothetical protein